MRGLWLSILLLLSASAGARAGDIPPPFTAVYNVQRGLFTVAQTRVAFSRPSDGHYRYRSRSEASGLAALFRDAEVHERSEGLIVERGLRPLRYTYRRTGDEARAGELRFYWEDGQVVNDVGGHPWRLDIPPGTRDRVVGSLQLMHDLSAGERELSYHVADGGRLRTYHFRVDGRERLDTGLGELQTLRVVRTDADGDGRTVLWCAPSLHYLAVRIEHSDPEEGDYVMTLKELKGLPATDEHR
ncbi:DUF3108 domain-containing protein [Ectothiorhodospiraceae bacterium WFHF3C12]|nr:DUF3108 domain-containing protein [Ectothiorhodospiraceae bacterium WFHF3C12]